MRVSDAVQGGDEACERHLVRRVVTVPKRGGDFVAESRLKFVSALYREMSFRQRTLHVQRVDVVGLNETWKQRPERL